MVSCGISIKILNVQSEYDRDHAIIDICRLLGYSPVWRNDDVWEPERNELRTFTDIKDTRLFAQKVHDILDKWGMRGEVVFSIEDD